MTGLLLAAQTETELARALGGGSMRAGWLLCGPDGIGKRTLAERLAAVHLSGGDALGAADPGVATQVANGGHPDLFVIERQANEKTGKMRGEIVVDQLRESMARLFRTSTSGRRAVIVDPADLLNRAAANAMLKSLEEPPEGTLFLLLTRAPGRLLPTITSRCRRVTLRPPPREAVVSWLRARTEADEAAAAEAARLAGDAPGRALSLLEGEGAARGLAGEVLAAASGEADAVQVASRAGAKANEAVWPEAWAIVEDRIGAALRGLPDEPLAARASPALMDALEEARALARRAAGLNADRTQTALMLTRTLRKGLNDARR